jgi:hypothetical protein
MEGEQDEIDEFAIIVQFDASRISRSITLSRYLEEKFSARLF